MFSDKLVNLWKTRLSASSDLTDNPAGFIEITNYDLVVAVGGTTDGPCCGSSGPCCGGNASCCCNSCGCPATSGCPGGGDTTVVLES